MIALFTWPSDVSNGACCSPQAKAQIGHLEPYLEDLFVGAWHRHCYIRVRRRYPWQNERVVSYGFVYCRAQWRLSQHGERHHELHVKRDKEDERTCQDEDDGART